MRSWGTNAGNVAFMLRSDLDNAYRHQAKEVLPVLTCRGFYFLKWRLGKIVQRDWLKLLIAACDNTTRRRKKVFMEFIPYKYKCN